MDNNSNSYIYRVNRDIIISDAGIYFRHSDVDDVDNDDDDNDSDDALLRRPIHEQHHMEPAEEYFKVPEQVHAESCPACDDIASGRTNLSGEYPPGWSLVSCQRHAASLNSVILNERYVGDIRECSRDAAVRYYKRRNQQKAQNSASAILESRSVATTTAPLPSSSSTTTTTITTTSTTSESPRSTECSICLEPRPNIKIDCRHTFCSPCLTHWAEEQIDQNLAEWFKDCPEVLTKYPILKYHAKSRYTCPMCRFHGQHTKQSRRSRKAWNNISRDLSPVMAARGTRGGQRRRRRAREGGETQAEEAAMAELPCAPASMPVVSRPSRR